MKCPLRSWRIASWLEASRRQRQTAALWATWTQAEPISRLREEIIFLYSALWAIFSQCLVCGPSNIQKTSTNIRELSRGHWHDGSEAGGDELVQLQAGTALERHYSTSSAYEDVTEKSRDGVFTAAQDRKGKTNRHKLKQERFSLDTRQFFFPRGQSGNGTACSDTLGCFKPQTNEALRSLTSKLWAGGWPPVVGRRLGQRYSEAAFSLWFSASPESLSQGDLKYRALYPNIPSTVVL